jgi:hypothetical protein
LDSPGIGDVREVFRSLQKDNNDQVVALEVVISCAPTETGVQGFAASSHFQSRTTVDVKW